MGSSQYSIPSAPFILHLAKHAYGFNRDIAWPVGGSLAFARMQMLDGKYVDERIRAICAEPPDKTNWAVHVFLGVNRDLSNEPSALVMLLDRPVVIAGHENRSLEMQLYGFDKVIDVPTLMTWERYMGETHGFVNMPTKKSNIIASLLGRGEERNLPGLSNFYFVGAWTTSTGALFSNANSGKKVIKTICSVDGKRFLEEA